MQHADGDRLAVPGPELEPAREQRDPPEAGVLGQESADLQVRVHPRLGLAEELEQQPIAQVDRAVGLLRPQRAIPGTRRPGPAGSRRPGSARRPAPAPVLRPAPTQELVASRTPVFATLQDQVAQVPGPQPAAAEQSNSWSTWAIGCCSSSSARRSGGEPGPGDWAGTSPTHRFRRVPLLAGGLELRARNRSG